MAVGPIAARMWLSRIHQRQRIAHRDIAPRRRVKRYGGAQNTLRELVAQGVAEEVDETYPKLIRFPGVLLALQIG